MSSGTPGTYLLPDLVSEFRRTHPGVRVAFELATSTEVVRAVRAHRAELGVVGAFVAAPEIEAEPLIEDEIVIVGPPGFAGRRLSRDEIETMTWISREEGSGTRVIADAALADLGIVPRHRLDLPAWEAIKLAVRRGQGIAAFSRLAVREELAAQTLAVIALLPWRVRRAFSIIRIRDGELSDPARKFLTMLRARRAGYSSPAG
jgi:DNA-binding transcriptional LysR family regulator